MLLVLPPSASCSHSVSVCLHRWLSYLLLLIVDLIICLLACLGLAKQSRWLLTT